MAITKVSEKDIKAIKVQDKTDWNKVYNTSQPIVDREAYQDSENPVLKNVRFEKSKR